MVLLPGETGGHHHQHDLQLPLRSLPSQHGVPAALLPSSLQPAERGDVRPALWDFSHLTEYQRSLQPRPSLLSNLPGFSKHISASIILTSRLHLELFRVRGVRRVRAGEAGDVRETQRQSGADHRLSPPAGAAAGRAGAPARLHGPRGRADQEGAGGGRPEDE